MNQEMILILDFGGQYNQLIARRVREHHVYCEIMPWKKSLEEIKAKNPKASSSQAAPTAFTMTLLLRLTLPCFLWAYPFWVSATAVS